MRFRRTILFHSRRGLGIPAAIAAVASDRRLDIVSSSDPDEVIARVNQSFPTCIVLDGSAGGEGVRLCRELKSDPFTAIIPVVFVLADADADEVLAGLEAGADEVLTPAMEEREWALRFQITLDRADRDVSVHPTTRLPGTVQIERDMAERIRRRELFAVCYADLDHFKEYNDRYGYNEGDRVIRMLARILRDIVKAYEPDGFIGHIGGDDFIFNVSLGKMKVCCEEVIALFDELIPYQYTEADREAGYFLGRDRRGNILWVPLMTLSIGVVTNEIRTFTHTARVSELATEMKAFAKKQSGSVYAVDRRSDSDTPGQFGRPGEDRDELEATTDS